MPSNALRPAELPPPLRTDERDQEKNDPIIQVRRAEDQGHVEHPLAAGRHARLQVLRGTVTLDGSA